MHHIGFNCEDPIAIERWYGKHFGFERLRVYLPGPDQVVVIGNGGVALELFPGAGAGPLGHGEKTDRPVAAGATSLSSSTTSMRNWRDGRGREDHAGATRYGPVHRGHASCLDLRPGRKHR